MSDSAAALTQNLGWLFCGIDSTIPLLWLLVHPFADRWRRQRRSAPYMGVYWVVLWALAWAVSSPWRHTLLYRAAWTWLLVIPLWTGALLLYVTGVRSLTISRIIGRAELRPQRADNRLITTGAHGLVRHPIYLGHLCTMLGWSVGTGSLACWSLTAFAVATGAIMVTMEERELEERFGEPYREYKRTVPMIVPRRK